MYKIRRPCQSPLSSVLSLPFRPSKILQKSRASRRLSLSFSPTTGMRIQCLVALGSPSILAGEASRLRSFFFGLQPPLYQEVRESVRVLTFPLFLPLLLERLEGRQQTALSDFFPQQGMGHSEPPPRLLRFAEVLLSLPPFFFFPLRIPGRGADRLDVAFPPCTTKMSPFSPFVVLQSIENFWFLSYLPVQTGEWKRKALPFTARPNAAIRRSS